MKKILVIALAVVMMVSAIAVLAACGGETVEGEYSYWAYDRENDTASTTSKYGCKVKVTVKGGVITAVEVTPDTATFYNLTATWTNDWTPNGTPTAGKQAWIDNGSTMAGKFVGMKVEDVQKIKVAVTKTINTETKTPAGQPTGITETPNDFYYVAGATQSSGRLILAIQNALSKLAK